MTVLYSNDFESTTHLATLSEFTAAGGGNWISLGPSFAPAPPARGSFRYGSADNSNQVYWNGNTSLTNVAMRHATKVLSGAYVSHLLRYNTSTGACYRCYYEWDGANLRGTISKWDGGSTVGTQQGTYNVPYVDGDVLHMESRAVGSTIELRLWTNTNARPSTPTITMTDSSYTTGAAGLRRVLGNSNYANVDDLVITDGAGGEDTFYPGAVGPTINTQPANQTVTAGATATFSVAATASGGSLSYQWQRNTVNISGATSSSYTTPATTVTGGSANNGDSYRCVVTDSNGSTTSSAATLTVNAGAGAKSGLNFFYRQPRINP